MTKPSEDLSRLSSPQVVHKVRRKMDQIQQPATEAPKSAFERKDIVDLSNGKPTPEADTKDPLAGIDINKYTKMLMEDIPDIRPDEIARVERMIAEDGYGPEHIEKMLDGIIEDL